MRSPKMIQIVMILLALVGSVYAYDPAFPAYGPGLVNAMDQLHIPSQQSAPLGTENDFLMWDGILTSYGESLAMPTPAIIIYGAGGITDTMPPTSGYFGTGFMRVTWTGRSTYEQIQYIELSSTITAYAPYTSITEFHNVGCETGNTMNAGNWSCYNAVGFRYYMNFYANGGCPTAVSQTASLYDGSVTVTSMSVDAPCMISQSMEHHLTMSLNYLANQYDQAAGKYFDVSNIKRFIINAVDTDYQYYHKSYMPNMLDGAVIMYYDYLTLTADIIPNDSPVSLSINATTIGQNYTAWLGWQEEAQTGSCPPVGYHIYRSTSAEGPYISLDTLTDTAGVGNDMEYIDAYGNTQATSQMYYYKVLTMDNGPSDLVADQRMNTINATFNEPLLNDVAEISILLPPPIISTATNTQTITPTITATITVTSTSLPAGVDLEITGLETTFENYTGPGDCYNFGDALGTRVYFRNNGAASTGSFVINLDGATNMITGLVGGESSSTWFAPMAHSAPALAIIDSTGMVAESNEANNNYMQMLVTPTPPPTCSPTVTSTETPDVPADSVGNITVTGGCYESFQNITVTFDAAISAPYVDLKVLIFMDDDNNITWDSNSVADDDYLIYGDSGNPADLPEWNSDTVIAAGGPNGASVNDYQLVIPIMAMFSGDEYLHVFVNTSADLVLGQYAVIGDAVSASVPISQCSLTSPTYTETFTETPTPTVTPGTCGVWVDADGVGQESLYCFESTEASGLPVVRTDSTGHANVVWAESTVSGSEIYFLKWNGSAWVDADGTGQESINLSNDSANFSSSPEMVLDASGNPHVVWEDNRSGEYEIYYLQWNGSAWVDADGTGQESINISNSIDRSGSPKIVLNSLGYPCITWQELVAGSHYEVYYLQWNGTAWVDADGTGQESIKVTNDDGGGTYANPALALDTSGNPHIAYASNADFGVNYLKWNGSAWVDADGTGQESINVMGSSGLPLNIDIAINNLDQPAIVWDTFQISYLLWNGSSWVDADGSGQESIDASQFATGCNEPKLKFDADNRPVIVYQSSGIYLHRWNGSAWVDADGAGQSDDLISSGANTDGVPSLDIDSDGNFHVVYMNMDSGNFNITYLKYLQCSAVSTETFTETETETTTPGPPTPTYTSGPYDSNGDSSNGGLGAGADAGQGIISDGNGHNLVVGYTWDANCSCYVMIIWRYNLDGSIDYTFGGGNGYILCPGSFTYYIDVDIDIQITYDGKFLITTYKEGCGGTCVDAVTYRYNTDWTIDLTFGGVGYVVTPNVCETPDQAKNCKVLVDETGNCYIPGSYWNGTSYDLCVYKYTEGGILDISFGSGGRCVYQDAGGVDWFDKACCISIGVDGKLYVLGETISNNPACTGECRIMVICRFLQNGTLDTNFGTGGCFKYSDISVNHTNCVPVSMIIDVDGKIVVTGQRWDTSCGCYVTVIWRFNIDMTIDMNFGNNGFVEYQAPNGCSPRDITIDINNNIIVTGIQDNGIDTDVFVIKCLPDGTFDTSFDTDGIYVYDTGKDDAGLSCMVDADYNIIIGGRKFIGTETEMLLHKCPDKVPTPTYTATPYVFDGEGCVRHNDAAGGNGSDCGKKVIKTDDGKLLVAGMSWDNACSCYSMIVWRFNIDGTIDFTFGNGKGYVKCPGLSIDMEWNTEIDIKIDINGDFYVTSYVDGCNKTCKDMVIYKFKKSGVLDTTFNNCGYVIHHDANNTDDKGYSLEIDASGRLLVTGSTWDTTCGCYVMAICRYNANGSVDSTFGTGGCVKVDNGFGMTVGIDIRVDINGKIVIVGYGDSGDAGCTGDCKEIIVVRLNEDGSYDTSFGTGGIFRYINIAGGQSHCVATSMEVLVDSRIVVTGYVDNGTGCDLSCRQMITIVITTTGVLDVTFNGTGWITHTGGCDGSAGMQVFIDDCGRIVIGGNVSLTGDINGMIWRFLMDGTLDTSFNITGYNMYAKTGGSEDFINSIMVNGCAEIIGTGYSRTDGSCSLSCFDTWLYRFYDGSTPTDTPVVTDTNTPTMTETITPSVTATSTITITPTEGTPLPTGPCLVLDSAFDLDGIVESADTTTRGARGYSISEYPSGQFVMGGMSDDTFSNGAVWKYNYDGTPDNTFGTNGLVNLDFGGIDHVYDVIVDSNGKIVAVGGDDQIMVVRLNADGTLDTTFNGTGTYFVGPATNTRATAVTIDSTGRILVTGSYYNNIFVKRFNNDGSLDTAFNGSGTRNITGSWAAAEDIAVDASGKILLTGHAQGATYWNMIIRRLNDNGSDDTTFNGTGQYYEPVDNTKGNTLIIDSSNRILVAGNADGYSGNVWRFNTDGTLDTSFGGTGKINTPGNIGFHGIVIDSTGNIVVAGATQEGSSVFGTYIKMYSDAGSFVTENIIHAPSGFGDDYGSDLIYDINGRYAIPGWTDVGSTLNAAVWRFEPGLCPATDTPTMTQTVTQTITSMATYTVTPTITMTVTQTVTQTLTLTVTDTITITVTPTQTQQMSSPTVTPTNTCDTTPPQFTVNMVFNPEHTDNIIFEIISSRPLDAPPSLEVWPHGKTDNKDKLTFVSELIPGETMRYRVLYPKQTGFGDIDKAIVRGTVCGVPVESNGDFDKEVISKKDVKVFKNVIKPDEGERTTVIFKVYDGDHVTARIYTRNGALVKTYYENEVFLAGDKEITWDGTNDNGVTVASGIYLLMIKTDFYTVNEKILVIR